MGVLAKDDRQRDRLQKRQILTSKCFRGHFREMPHRTPLHPLVVVRQDVVQPTMTQVNSRDLDLSRCT